MLFFGSFIAIYDLCTLLLKRNEESYTVSMKILLWFILPLLFIAAYFIVPHRSKQPEEKPKVPIMQPTENIVVPETVPVSLSVSPDTLIHFELRNSTNLPLYTKIHTDSERSLYV